MRISCRVPISPNDPKDDQKDVQKELTERQRIILNFLLSDNSVTLEQMSKRINVSLKTVQRELDLLKAHGYITREGGRTFGHWVVNNM